MYQYDTIDKQIVAERIQQFRGQVERRLSGELSEEEFRPLRLMNGLYLQLHAYMLRVAIPYGTLSATQMRTLAGIARRYDRGYGHFTTRQNIQFNWPKLTDVPDILSDLAEVEMHAIQTSGNCIRNVTTDAYAGVAADEIADPRPWAELIRQWSTFHPEFSFLPRKFKIALTGSPADRAAIRFHDIGLQMKKSATGEIGFEVFVGGGQGRTPVIAKSIKPFIATGDLLSYLEAILRVYNLEGRRDNIYKARIKILVEAMGTKTFAAAVEEEWQTIRDRIIDKPARNMARIRQAFAPPAYEFPAPEPENDTRLKDKDVPDAFFRWRALNTLAHRQPGYAIAVISLKPPGGIPGDATARQMDIIADLAELYSLGEIRVTHEQNLVLPHLRQYDLPALWRILEGAGLGTANLGHATDIIACPGLDYCNLANARSIPLAQEISKQMSPERLATTGPLALNISGCINACGHHHVGDIGLLGVDRKGEEYYQITLGGRPGNDAAIGEVIGPAFSRDDVIPALNKIIDTYLDARKPDEEFAAAWRRMGPKPFKEVLYDSH